MQANKESSASSGESPSSYSRIHVTNAFDFDIRKELDDLDAMCDAGDAGDAIGALDGFNAVLDKYGRQRHDAIMADMV